MGRRSEVFEVRDEGAGWLSIYRGNNTMGAPLRCAVRLVTFEGEPTEVTRPRQRIWGTDCGAMPDEGAVLALRIRDRRQLVR